MGQTDIGTDSEGAIDLDGQLVQPVEYEKQRQYGAEKTVAKTQWLRKERAESVLQHHLGRDLQEEEVFATDRGEHSLQCPFLIASRPQYQRKRGLQRIPQENKRDFLRSHVL